MFRSAFFSMLIFVGLCLPVCLFGQSELAKTLIDAYDKAPDFETKKEAFRKLERFYRYYHIDSSLVFSENFKNYCLQHRPSYVPFVDLNIGASYTRKLELEKASSILLPILEKAEKEANDTLRAKALLNLANLNKAQKRKELGLERAMEAARLNEKMKLWQELGIDYIAISGLYSGTDTARIYLKKVLDLAEKHGFSDVKGAALNNLGVVYHPRPPGAPAITEATFTPEQMARFLRGIEGQPPGNVTTIVATGQWYVPMRHPGMTPPYDLRGWHAAPAPVTPAASPPR